MVVNGDFKAGMHVQLRIEQVSSFSGVRKQALKFGGQI